MAVNERLPGNDLLDDIQQKVKSLTTVLSQIKQPSHNYEFDPSICNNIYTYIKVIQTDCQRIIKNNKYNLFSNNDCTAQNINDNINMLKSIQMVNNNDHYHEKIQKFEIEIDFHVDEVIKSIQLTSNILNTHYEEISLLNEQTIGVHQNLNSQKKFLNDEIDKFNNNNVKIQNTFCQWKERLQQKNDKNILLANEAHTLFSIYKQKMLMVKNNITNIVESVSKSLSLRAECLKLEIRTRWEGDTILKMYKFIDKLIEVNGSKLNCYNDLLFHIGNINKDAEKTLDFIVHTSFKMKKIILEQIEKHNNVNQIAEEKFRQMYELNQEIRTIEELKLNSEEYLNNLECKIKENKEEITIKRQQINDANNKIEYFKNRIEIKAKFILDHEKLIEKKQSQLKIVARYLGVTHHLIRRQNYPVPTDPDIELIIEKETKELKIKKMEWLKKQTNIEIMNFILNHYEKETKEKLQFYHDYIIQPLEHKLQNSMALVDMEKIRNNRIKASDIDLSPEFKKIIENVKSQIKQLDKTLNVQYGTLKQLEEDFQNIQLNVLHQLGMFTVKNDKYINIFQTAINYRLKMEKNIEIKQKNTILECEIFQKRYEIERKREKLEEEEQLLMSQLNELKQLVRQQAAYNKKLLKQYIHIKK